MKSVATPERTDLNGEQRKRLASSISDRPCQVPIHRHCRCHDVPMLRNGWRHIAGADDVQLWRCTVDRREYDAGRRIIYSSEFDYVRTRLRLRQRIADKVLKIRQLEESLHA